jgi:hypothetical protein
MKALVVNPWVTDFKLYDEWMHPVGLYFLMSFLEQNGVDVSYFNFLSRSDNEKSNANGTGAFPSREFPKPSLYKNVRRRYKLYGRPVQDFESFSLSLPRPDVICVGSAMTYWVAGLKQTIDVLAKAFPGIPCIVGGTAATLMPPQVLRSMLSPAHIFGGTVFDGASASQRGSGTPFLADMTLLPYHASMIAGLQRIDRAWHAPALTSLGCPLSCTYCASNALFGGFQARPPDIVANEIEYMVAHRGVRDIAFYDDALLYKPEEHVLPLLKILRDRGISARFHIPNGMHVRWITPQLIDIMLASGFTTIRLGYESGRTQDMRQTRGKATPEQLAQKVLLMRKAGFAAKSIGVYLMGGLPGQMPQDVIREIDAVATLGIAVKPVFLSPVPKTALFDQYAKQFPEIVTDPLWHNDSFFITQLPGWNADAVQEVMDRAKNQNAKLPTDRPEVS